MSAGGLMGSCADPDQARTGGRARLTTGLIVEFTPFFVAEARDLFAENGVVGDLQGFIIANDGAKAQLAGEADASTLVELPWLGYVDQGEDLISVCVVTTARNLKLVAKNDIGGPDDLPNRKVAYPFGTGQDYGFAAYLKKFGIDHAAVDHVNSENAELLPLIARGDVDAIVAVEPQVSQALDNGKDKLAVVEPGPAEAYQTRSHLNLKRSWAEGNAEAVGGVMRALMEAQKVIEAEPDECAEIMGDKIRVDPAEVKRLWKANEDDWTLYLDRAALDALDSVRQWLADNGKLSTDIDVNTLVEPAYLADIDESAVTL